MRPPSRSAAPLASAGIVCLGLVPTLGGPESPLHWAMTASMTGFGLLLLFRHRLGRSVAPLTPVTQAAARQAGRAVLWITAISTLLVIGIVVLQLLRGGGIAPLSVVMPVLGLLWLASLGRKALRWPADAAEPPATSDRPSRRPPAWERVATPGSTPPDAPNRQARA